MPSPRRAHNGGPSVAPRNRAAILAAARQVFAEQGYHVPVSAIARAAGVGQGVMYRHFPSRIDLAKAVFEESFVALERLATDTPGPDAFHVLWRRLVDETIASTAFIDLVIAVRATLPESVGEQRLERLIAEPLRRAQAAGLADPAWHASDVLLLIHMVHGVVIGQERPDETAAAVHRALQLVDRRLT